MNSLKQVGLRIYYHLLKLHQAKLPPNILPLGNAYIREEFKLAHQKANQEQYIEFIQRWVEYYHELNGKQGWNVGRNITDEEMNFLNEDQRKALQEMESQIKSQKKE